MLNMGARSLQAQQAGTEVTGHNIANANNPAYARQRLALVTSTPLPTPVGDEGTGVDMAGISQVRDSLLDGQIQVETSMSGSLTAQQSALQQAEAALGQSLDTTNTANGSTAATDATGSQHGLGDALNGLFTQFQSLANDPTSLTQRSVLLMNASDLASRFNQIDSRIATVQGGLDTKLKNDVSQANQLLSDIARLNHQITSATLSGSTPNDLMDTRQSKIEALSALVKVDVSQGTSNALDISVAGASLVADDQVTDTIETFTDTDSQLRLRTHSQGTSLLPDGGSIQGVLAVRDGAINDIRQSVNTLAASLIAEVNAAHSGGFSLTGSSGESFFTGTSAADIGVNKTLVDNPSLLQASGALGAKSNNQVAVAMAQLAGKPIDSLSGQTFSGGYSNMVTRLGQAAATVNTQLADQKVVENMLVQQRSSSSGVSLDEEMTNMMTYQKAFQASAKIVSAVDEMLSTVINMKQ